MKNRQPKGDLKMWILLKLKNFKMDFFWNRDNITFYSVRE